MNKRTTLAINMDLFDQLETSVYKLHAIDQLLAQGLADNMHMVNPCFLGCLLGGIVDEIEQTLRQIHS